jgi:hypothetical protein
MGLQHLYKRESNKLLTGINLKISYNRILSLRMNIVQIDKELNRRNQLQFNHYLHDSK